MKIIESKIKFCHVTEGFDSRIKLEKVIRKKTPMVMAELALVGNNEG